MRLFSSRVKDSTKSTLVAGFFAISQLLIPLLAVMPVQAVHGDTFTPIASSSGTSPSVQIDQCRNGGDGSIVCANSAWSNGNANGTQANYFEGDSIPYRSVFKNLEVGETYTLEIEWDTTEGGDHAIDYLTSFNRTLTDADPCSDIFSDCVSNTPHTAGIPVDPNVSAEGVIQEAGNFTIYNGNISNVSGYTLSGTYAGSSQTSITVTFTAEVDDWVVLAWGGHISTRADWGLENAAVNIPGSPFHMRLIDFDCSNPTNCSVGQQDRSLSSDAVTFPADITIIKQASPEGDASFDFTGDLGEFSLIDDGTLLNTKTFNVAEFGEYNISETVPGGWSLNDISCEFDEASTGSVVSTTSPTATIDVEEGDIVTCTFQNDLDEGTLKIVKNVINDDGGDKTYADFTFKVDSDSPENFEADLNDTDGYDGVKELTLPVGTYNVTEPEEDTMGYSTSYEGCSNISVTLGQIATCTITNDDLPPTLTLQKNVTNDNNGNNLASEWKLTAKAEGETALIDQTGTSDGDDLVATTSTEDAVAGVAYDLSEDGPDGYTAGDWSCDGGTLNGSTVTLALDEDVTCEITNDDDAPTLTVVKKVVNNNGGTALVGDFDIELNDIDVTFGAGSVDGTTTTYTATPAVDANTSYTLSEIDFAGYSEGAWSCTDGTQGTGLTVTINLDEGEDVTCTVTNDDIAPKLTLVKKVVNDDGGDKEQDDWTLTASGPDLLQDKDETESLETGVSGNVEAGTYTLSESSVDGYELTSIKCNGRTVELTQGTGQITIGLAADVTCVFTNDDIAPTLRLVKETQTVNDNPTQVFELYVEQDEDGLTDDYDVDTDETNDDYLNTVVLDGEDGLMAGDVTVGEVVPEGWELAMISCSPTVSGEQIGAEYNEGSYDFTLNPGDDVTCTFVNAEQPDIKVTKYWDIDQDGYFDQTEVTLPGWTFNLEECVYLNGTTQLVVNSLGEVPGDCDTPYSAEDYEAAFVANPVLSQETDETGSTTFENLSPFSYFVLSEDLQEGWNISGMRCEYPNEQGGGVALNFNRYFIYPAPGQTVECYVGNYQDSQLFIEKTNDRIGDQLVAGDAVVYTITVSNPEDSGIVYDNVTYDIMPEAVTYTAGSWTAVSDVRGAIAGALDDGSDYVNDGPATWELGDIVPGETVTLTYAATVDADTEPGTYENVAWNEGWACEIKLPYLEQSVDVRAENLLNAQVQYNDETNYYSCFSDECEYDFTALEHSKCRTYGNVVSVYATDASDEDPFVESAIEVVVEEDEEGFVLGVLSVTGVPAILPSAIGLTLVSAALLLSRAGGNRKQRRWLKGLAAAGKNLLVALVMTVAFSAGAIAVAPWQLNVVDLPDVTGDNTPQISYTVAAADATETFTVELYQDAVLIDTQNITSNNGGSGQFNVPEVADGDYDFTVLVTNNDTTEMKQHTESVVIDTDTPTAPVYEGVERSGNTYTLNFTVPGGDVDKVRIYASTDTEFDLSSANLVKTLTVAPGDDVTTTYVAPNAQQRYFAVVAVDSAGNTSSPSGDSRTVVVDSEGNPITNGTVNNGGSTADDGNDSDDGGAVLPEQDDANNGDDGADANGDAEDATDDTDDETSADDGTNGWLVALLVAAILGLGYYYFGRKSER